MEKRIILNDLISYVLEICKSYKDDSENIYNISTLKNDLEESHYTILKYGEVSTLGDLPKKLKKIFDPFISDAKRVGVLANKGKLINISLLYSILYCIKDNFMDLTNGEKVICIDEFNDKMLSDLYSKNLFENYGYKELGWNQKELSNSLIKFKNNIMVIRFLADYLSINIFILSVNEDKIYAVYPEENYNIFKPSILLAFYDEVFEPIVYQDNKIWCYDLEPLKKLINIDKMYIGILNDNFSKDCIEKVFQTGTEDLSTYLSICEGEDIVDDKMVITEVEGEAEEEVDSENNYGEVCDVDAQSDVYIDDPEETEIDIDTVKDTKDIFCTKDEIEKKKAVDKYDPTIIQEINIRMKLQELQKVAKVFGINIVKGKTKNGKDKFKTKKELYEEMTSMIKKN